MLRTILTAVCMVIATLGHSDVRDLSYKPITFSVTNAESTNALNSLASQERPMPIEQNVLLFIAPVRDAEPAGGQRMV